MVIIENLKTLKYHTFSKKTLVFSIICSKCENEDENIFKEEESLEKLQILGLIKIYTYFKNMAEENVRQVSRLKNIDKTKKLFR